jgi:hypothetical protein
MGLSFPSKAQPLSLNIIWYESKNSCNNGFAYKGRITIDDGSISLYRCSYDSEEYVGKFVIISQRSKWKITNYTGFSDYKVVQLLDSTKKNIKLSLKRGSGKMEISDRNSDFTLLVSK